MMVTGIRLRNNGSLRSIVEFCRFDVSRSIMVMVFLWFLWKLRLRVDQGTQPDKALNEIGSNAALIPIDVRSQQRKCNRHGRELEAMLL